MTIEIGKYVKRYGSKFHFDAPKKYKECATLCAEFAFELFALQTQAVGLVKQLRERDAEIVRLRAELAEIEQEFNTFYEQNESRIMA